MVKTKKHVRELIDNTATAILSTINPNLENADNITRAAAHFATSFRVANKEGLLEEYAELLEKLSVIYENGSFGYFADLGKRLTLINEKEEFPKYLQIQLCTDVVSLVMPASKPADKKNIILLAKEFAELTKHQRLAACYLAKAIHESNGNG